MADLRNAIQKRAAKEYPVTDPFLGGTYRVVRGPSGWRVEQQHPQDPARRQTVFEGKQDECEAWVAARTPHPYQPEAGNTRWRTCAICGRGANASIHKAQPKTSMATTILPGLTLEKGDNRYYVFVDGIKVGWVSNLTGSWTFWSPVRDSIEGTRLAEESTRRDVIAEGLSTLRIRHGGWVKALDPEHPGRDTDVVIPEARLRELWDKLLDLKYGL